MVVGFMEEDSEELFQFFSAAHCVLELDMYWIHPWIGLDWIGSDDCNPLFFSCIYFLYLQLTNVDAVTP